MINRKSKWQFRFATIAALAGLVSMAACERPGTEGEAVEAEEIAEGQGIADPDEKGALETVEVGESGEPSRVGEIAEALILDEDSDMFQTFDTDQDNYVSQEEFELGAEQVTLFGTMDVNEDKKITDEEFHASLFGLWDRDNNKQLTKSEYLYGALRFFPEDTDELAEFADIDQDDDNRLSRDEFIANMDDIALFDQWDLDDDAEISPAAMAQVLRDVWDVDRDFRISKEEFGGKQAAQRRQDTSAEFGIAEMTVVFTRPVDYVGRSVTGTAKVDEVVSDRGFWLGEGDNRLFTVIREDTPRKEMIDINAGQRLNLTGFLVKSEAADNLTGELDDKTKKILEEEDQFLAVYHGQVNIVGDGS